MATSPRWITIRSTFAVALLGLTLMNGYALAQPPKLADNKTGDAPLKVGTVVLYDNDFSGTVRRSRPPATYRASVTPLRESPYRIARPRSPLIYQRARR